MQRTDDAGRAAPLVLELASGTATLHGEELELPLREFRLLVALAARVGEPVASDLLIKAVWPDAPWTSTNDLYVLVSKLRRLIDGPDKFGNNIRNRRGFGYMLDIEPEQLIVIDPAAVSPTPLTIDLTETSAEEPVEETIEASSPSVNAHHGTLAPKRRALRGAPTVAVAIILVAASWGTGYILSRRNADRVAATADGAPEAQLPDDKSPAMRAGTQSGTRKDSDKRPGKHDTRRSRLGSVIADPDSGDSTTSAQGISGSSQGSDKGSRKNQAPAPALPPAPTRYLYHLVNPETGDHFVTTDRARASEQEARGYEGGAIARVYTYREDNTKAITTNHGTAYIFIQSSPKTEPASKTIALWYSTNGAGDFFYSISEAKATQEGWTGSVIGYVRAL